MNSKNIYWEPKYKKWLCYENIHIDRVLKSPNFIAPKYDVTGIEKRFAIDLSFTRGAIRHLPIAHEGLHHQDLRGKMSHDIYLKSTHGLNIFKKSLVKRLSNLKSASGGFDIAPPIICSILESNLILADVVLEEDFDYSDITLILDESQSIKSRIQNENLIRNIANNISGDATFYKIALITVGVNALISSTLHSIIKVLTNSDFQALINKRYFSASGIKYLERICIKDFDLDAVVIKAGDSVRLYQEDYESLNLNPNLMNKKFFFTGTTHSCLGMGYMPTNMEGFNTNYK